jgi:hypothetical protein
MIQSFVFNDGKLVASNFDSDTLRLVSTDKRLCSSGSINLHPTPRGAGSKIPDLSALFTQ